MGNFKVKIRQKAALHRREPVHRLRHVHRRMRVPRPSSTTSSSRAWACARRSTLPFPQAVPRIPVVDPEACTAVHPRQVQQICVEVCGEPTPSTSTQKDEIDRGRGGQHHHGHRLEGVRPRGIPQYGYGRLANVYTNMEFERLCNAAGPTNGKIVLRDGKTEPKRVAIIHCVGSRDANHQRLLLARLLHGGAEVRPPGAGEDQGRGLLVLHRHADAGQGLRGVLPAAARRGHALRPRQGGRGDRRRRRTARRAEGG